MSLKTAKPDDYKIALATDVYREAVRVLGLQSAPRALREIVAAAAKKYAAEINDREELLDAVLRAFFQDPLS